MPSFTDQQIAELEAPLSASNVAQRTQAGRKLSYIEAWHAIAEANRIFGFDAWSRETVEMRQLGEPREVNGNIRVGYFAKVRIVVTAPDGREIVREGSGFGSGIDKDVGQAHESAIKEAESDAMKRALMTFGNPFGLALYDKTQANVVAEPTARDLAIKQLNAARDLDDMKAIWVKHAKGWQQLMDYADYAAVEKAKESLKITLGASQAEGNPFTQSEAA